ncbi:hypothetical protein GCM10009827_048540 [Dactylosporangium maewongense]|uniref:PH domain-containing protein n=1 Tax=Dactylosporangium maewongense TaxID=634393 RepID=A0ABN2ASH3_9ACTN
MKRIPGDLSFVVRRGTGRWTVLIGGISAAAWVLLMILVSAGLLTGGSPDRTNGDAVAVAAIGLCALVVLGALAVAAVRIAVSGGPVLALDSVGLWVRNSRGLWGTPVWVPWVGVSQLTRARRLTVLTTDGVRYSVPLRFNDRTPAEIVGAVGRFSGRPVLEA